MNESKKNKILFLWEEPAEQPTSFKNLIEMVNLERDNEVSNEIFASPKQKADLTADLSEFLI